MRGVTDINGLRDIRSVRGTGRRGIPRVQSSAYLDLYMLQKERERLQKEAALLAKRNRGIQGRLAEIEKHMGDLERPAGMDRSRGRGSGGVAEGGLARTWRTFPIKY